MKSGTIAGKSEPVEPFEILILEAGTGKGGSSNALIYDLEEIDKELFHPIVGFYYPIDILFRKMLKLREAEILEMNLPHSGNILGKYLFLNRTAKVARYLLSIMALQIPAAIRLAGFIERKKIKLVFFNNDLGLHLVGFLAAKIAGIPCIVRKAGYGHNRRITRLISPFVHGFLAISHATARDQESDCRRKHAVQVVYRGVDLARFNPYLDDSGLREELGLSGEDVLVATISRISPGKGHKEFIKAASEVIKIRKNIRFLVVGDDGELRGTFASKIKEQIQQLKLEDYIIFAGWRMNIPQILAATDIFVHCPTELCMEGLGVAAVEAAATGRPSIVTNDYGLPETVINGRTGFVVKMGSHGELAEKILMLAQNDRLRKRMGENARKFAEERFDIKLNMRKVEDFVISFIEGKK